MAIAITEDHLALGETVADLARKRELLEANHALLEADEEDHDVALRIVGEHAEGHVAQQGGLARARGRDDEAAGAFADGAEKINRPGGQPAILQFHFEKLIG